MSGYVIVATRARDRWFDLDAVRTEYKFPDQIRAPLSQYKDADNKDSNRGTLGTFNARESAGAPPLDWYLDDDSEPKWADHSDLGPVDIVQLTRNVIVATRARDRWFDLDAVRTATDRDDLGGSHTGRLGPDGKQPSNVAGSNPAGAPPLDWYLDDGSEPKWATMNAGSARFLLGDVFDQIATLPDHSVDLVLSSPPFLALRSYLPANHPDKSKEMGSESTPAQFLDTLLALVAALDRVLAPHGTLAFELGDTYAGSGGAGGDYGPDGMRGGQERFQGSGVRKSLQDNRSFASSNRNGAGGGRGWPPDKSLTFIPELFGASLAYGRNLLTGQPSPAGQWRVRNVIPWARPNPPVGALGDKWRPATSYVTVACRARDRWFDLDAVRLPGSPNTNARLARGVDARPESGKKAENPNNNFGSMQVIETAGAPPLDWYQDDQAEHQPDGLWVINTEGFSGAHYATFPRELVRRLVECMCPREVCRTCGRPRRRIVGKPEYVPSATYRGGIAFADGQRMADGVNQWTNEDGARASVVRSTTTLGWTHCACGDGCRPTTWRVDEVETVQVQVDGKWEDLDGPDEPAPGQASRIRRKRKRVVDDLGHCADPSHFRPGVVLDPFCGSSTTLAVAVRCGRDAVGIDLDSRNIALARQRMGVLPLTVVGDEPPTVWPADSLFGEEAS